MRQDYQTDLALLDRVNCKRVCSRFVDVPDLVAERLFERLSLLKSKPHRVVDLGAGAGRHMKHLQRVFPKANIYAADLSACLLRQARSALFWKKKPPLICLDAQKLPFADNSIDLVVSNLMLPWIHPPDNFAAELQRALAPNGAFFFTTTGPDTLSELRSAWRLVDSSAHVNMMLDMHDIGDVLLRSGIADPVVDAERLQINYSGVDTLLDELISSGLLCVLKGRRRGLFGSDIRERLTRHYPVNNVGGVTASLEIIYAHGWKGQATPRSETAKEIRISVDAISRPK